MENEERIFDPETIDGDYAEAYQRWHHHFSKASDKIKECFKETAIVPFKPFFDPEIHTPKWKFLDKSLKENQKRMNDGK